MGELAKRALTPKEFAMVHDLKKVAVCNRYASAQAMQQAHTANLQELSKLWDAAFGFYAIIEGSLIAVAESMLVDLMPKIYPSDRVRVEAKKQYGKQYRRWQKETYPHYHQEAAQAMNLLSQEGVRFYEKWAKSQLYDGADITNGVMDYADEKIGSRKFILYNSAKMEMASMRFKDADLRAHVYAVWVMWHLVQDQYRAFMNIGPCKEWGKIRDGSEEHFHLLELSEEYRDKKSPWYSQMYEARMKPADMSHIVKALDVVKLKICGTWTHQKQGHVNLQLTGIKNIICRNGYVQEVPFDNIIADSGFDEELSLINSIYFFKNGYIDSNIYMLRAVRMMMQGMTIADIEKRIKKTYSVNHRKLEQLLLTVALCQEIYKGRLDIEKFNDYMAQKDAEAQAKGITVFEDVPNIDLTAFSIQEVVGVVSEGIKLENEPPAPLVSRKRWTDEEERFLCNHYMNIPMCQHHLGRTESAIKAKIYRLGLYEQAQTQYKSTQQNINFKNK